MNTRVERGFEGSPVEVPVSQLMPSKNLDDVKISGTKKFSKVLSSIRSVGVIEPLIVFPAGENKFVLLDGHIRLMAARQLELSSLPCLVAKDDESFTYNRRVNRLATIQEHLMVKKALQRGLSEERLAEALDVDVGSIHRKARLLDGVCEDAVRLLKDYEFAYKVMEILRLMKPSRQVEVIELMIAANQITAAYCKAFLMATPPELLVDRKRPFAKTSTTADSIIRLERELSNVTQRYKMIEQSYGQDALTLVLLRGYMTKLLDNEAVFRFIFKKHPELLGELQTLAKNENAGDVVV